MMPSRPLALEAGERATPRQGRRSGSTTWNAQQKPGEPREPLKNARGGDFGGPARGGGGGGGTRRSRCRRGRPEQTDSRGTREAFRPPTSRQASAPKESRAVRTPTRARTSTETRTDGGVDPTMKRYTQLQKGTTHRAVGGDRAKLERSPARVTAARRPRPPVGRSEQGRFHACAPLESGRWRSRRIPGRDPDAAVDALGSDSRAASNPELPIDPASSERSRERPARSSPDVVDQRGLHRRRVRYAEVVRRRQKKKKKKENLRPAPM